MFFVLYLNVLLFSAEWTRFPRASIKPPRAAGSRTPAENKIHR